MRRLLPLLAVCAAAGPAPARSSMYLSSPGFQRNAELPVEFTCQGEGVAPPLAWGDAPSGTKSIAILVDDPDARGESGRLHAGPGAPHGFTHWLVYDITPALASLPRGGALPPGAVAGYNSLGTTAYLAPCPPAGTHHYRFQVYALDTMLPRTVMTEDQFLAAIQGHVTGYGEDVARFAKITRP